MGSGDRGEDPGPPQGTRSSKHAAAPRAEARLAAAERSGSVEEVIHEIPFLGVGSDMYSLVTMGYGHGRSRHQTKSFSKERYLYYSLCGIRMNVNFFPLHLRHV